MHFKDFRCQIWKNTWIFPFAIGINVNEPVYRGKNFAITFHLLCVHMRWFWLQER